jgi:hypothetical protein
MDFLFISRHDLNKGQEAIIKMMGFEGSKKLAHNFKDTINPLKEFKSLVGDDFKNTSKVGLVGPTHLFINLLTKGGLSCPHLIEFINVPSARERGKFLCKGAMEYWFNGTIQSRFIPCPLSEAEQDEGDLNYKAVGG